MACQPAQGRQAGRGHVLFVNHFGGLSGAERSMVELAVALQGAGHQITLCVPGGGQLEAEAERRELRIAELPGLSLTHRRSLLWNLGRLLKATAVYGGVLLAGGWQQWWWMAGLLLALGAGVWIFRSRVMDTRTRDRGQEPPRWHWSQYFALWLPVIPLVARLSEGWVGAVVVALAGAAHLYWFLARGGWR